MISSKEMENYFNEFWWKIWLRCLWIIPSALESEKESLKSKMIKEKQLKRKVLLAKHIKYKIWNSWQAQQMEDYNIVLIGASGSGKTSICNMFVSETFSEESIHSEYHDSHSKDHVVDGLYVQTNLTDTCLNYIYENSSITLRRGSAFIVVCDVTNSNSVEGAKDFVEELFRVKDCEIPIVFALNKIDLVNDSDREEVLTVFTNNINLLSKPSYETEELHLINLTNPKIIECSAKTGENINRLFEECVKQVRILESNKKGHNLELLENVIEYDVKYIELMKNPTLENHKKAKKCLLM